MDRTNIWQLLDSSGIGGIETHVTLLTQALRSRGMNAEIVLLNNHGPHPLAATWRQAGIPVRVLKDGIFGLQRCLNKEHPNLVHTHGYKAGILGRLAGQVTTTPVVSTYHAGEPGAGRIRLYNKLDAEISCGAPRIAVSEEIAARIGGDVHVIPNFISVPSMPFCGGDTVTFVGRLSHEKGPDRFVEIANSLPEISFEVFGDGPMRAELESQVTRNIRFHGNVPSMAHRWRNIGLLCISSRHEGLPMVALEAMANGVPVAGFGVGALPDVIENLSEGYIVPPGDTAQLASAITTWSATNLSERAQMIFKAHRKIKSTYSTDVIVPRIIEVYSSLLQSAAAPSRITSAKKVAA